MFGKTLRLVIRLRSGRMLFLNLVKPWIKGYALTESCDYFFFSSHQLYRYPKPFQEEGT